MPVTRIVPNLRVADVQAANALYAGLLDLETRMDLGWVGNLGPRDRPDVQLQTLARDAAAGVEPEVSIGVDRPEEVDAVHDRVVAAGLEVVHPLADEEWGVRRFFFRDPDGHVVNVVAHR